MTLRALVCDDEPIAIARMVALLKRIPDLDVVATALDGPAAVEAVEATAPDLLFLDIDMPGLDGFEVVRSIEARRQASGRTLPLITFVTAYRRRAPEAFDSGALDFLSKPVRLVRLEQCVARARRQVAVRATEMRIAQLEEKVEALRTGRPDPETSHVWVHRRSEQVRIDFASIDRVTAEGPYVRLHAADATYLYREAIGAMANRLGADEHARVHRSHIVRISQVASIKRTRHGGAELILRNGERIPVGRCYAKEIRRRLLHLNAQP